MAHFFTDSSDAKIDVETHIDEKHAYVSFATTLTDKELKMVRARVNGHVITFYLDETKTQSRYSSMFGYFMVFGSWSLNVAMPVLVDHRHYQLEAKNGVVDAVFDIIQQPKPTEANAAMLDGWVKANEGPNGGTGGNFYV